MFVSELQTLSKEQTPFLTLTLTLAPNFNPS